MARQTIGPPPPSVDVSVEFGARSRRGPQRPVNEDHYLVLRMGRSQETLMTSLPDHAVSVRFDEFGYGMVIADGLGDSGEDASRLAVSTLVDVAIYFGKWQVRIDEPIAEEVVDRARWFLRNVDAALLAAGSDSERRLQTTMTVAYTAGSELFFAHVGHSRAYLFRDDVLMQLTHDHTIQRTRGPAIVDMAAASQDQHHIVTQTLGGAHPGGSRIDVERFGLVHDDIILLCTNGLSDAIDDRQIAAALRSHAAPDDQCGALVDLAADAGGQDDMTALVAHYRIAKH